MRGKIYGQQGFTFVEIMMVLSIAVLLTVMMMPIGFKWMQKVSEEEAIDALLATIYSLQSYSIAHNEYTKLSFQTSEGTTSYIAAAPGKEVFANNALPSGMSVADSSSLKSVEFHGNGNIAHSGVLTIVSPAKRTAITFQFQRGRMIIRESERLLVARSDINNRGTIGHFWYTFA